MSYSLNEVEAMAKKASRGAGYHWGIAEEAAYATRWLCAHGFDGCEALASLLPKSEHTDFALRTPKLACPVWHSRSGRICPLLAGAALGDYAFRLQDRAISLANVEHPIMLLPFAAVVARRICAFVTVEWDGVWTTTDGSNVSRTVIDRMIDSSTGRSLMQEIADLVIVRIDGRIGGGLHTIVPGKSRASPSPAAWDCLNQFAHRTYAPATEESRRMGAGASSCDND